MQILHPKNSIHLVESYPSLINIADVFNSLNVSTAITTER